MAISRSQMEQQIRGFATGGIFDAVDIFREDEKDPFAIPAMPPGIAPLPYAPNTCLLYTSPSPRDGLLPRMPSSA